MGPVFGRKGGATGGGASRVEPSNTINLQFTGDFHAITAAHNLLAAAIDNRLHFGDLDLDPARVLWKRALDMNDRALRQIVIGLGGQVTGVPRDRVSISRRRARSWPSSAWPTRRPTCAPGWTGSWSATTASGQPVMAKEIGVTGSMAAILNEAILPNLVQTTEWTPAFVHGGPFANIAHGCNSILATRMALAMADYAVTEAGFAFDLGGEKFFDLKCRAGGFNPAAIVLVATVRALKMHGGVSSTPARPRSRRRRSGDSKTWPRTSTVPSISTSRRSWRSTSSRPTPPRNQGRPRLLRSRGIPCATANVFGAGGRGATELAEKVVAAAAQARDSAPAPLSSRMAGRAEDRADRPGHVWRRRREYPAGRRRPSSARPRKLGYGELPICMAKTQDSLSDNPKLRGRPRGFTLTVRDIEIAAGAGFLVALTGDIVRMPGLPERPAAERIDVDQQGRIVGLA